MSRPQPGPDPAPDWTRGVPEGYVLRWTEDPAWREATDAEHEGGKCRRPGCRRRPAACLLRRAFFASGVREVRWLYCDWHLYGRRIVEGRVESLRVVEAE